MPLDETEPLDATDRAILQQVWSTERTGYATNSTDIGALAGDIARALEKNEDVARRLRSLEARGLARREPGQFNGMFTIALTEKAKILLQKPE